MLPARKHFLFSSVIVLCASTGSFACTGDFGRYQSVDADRFLEEYKSLRPTRGINAYDLELAYRFDGKLAKAPAKISDHTLPLVAAMLGRDVPSAEYELEISTRKDNVLKFTVPNKIAESIISEAKTVGVDPAGANIRLWAINLYNAANQPGLLVTCAQVASDVQADSQIPQKNPLQDFIRGSRVAWYSPTWDEKKLAENMDEDCDRAFSASEDALYIHYLDNYAFISADLWGAKASEEKRKAFPRYIEPISGHIRSRQKAYFQKQPDGSLVVISKTAEGQYVQSSFIPIAGDGDHLIVNYLGPLYPSTEERQALANMKKIGMYKPQKVKLCTRPSYDEHMKKRRADPRNKKMPPDALSFVLDKKWAAAGLNCGTSNSFYFMFSQNYASGYATIIQGRIGTDEPSRTSSSFTKIDATSFEHKYSVRANDNTLQMIRSRDRNLMAAEVINRVTMLSPTHIEIKRTMRSLDLNSLIKGQVRYETKTENASGNLCE